MIVRPGDVAAVVCMTGVLYGVLLAPVVLVRAAVVAVYDRWAADDTDCWCGHRDDRR